MVNWESQSKTPPQSPEDGHILLIRIAFCHVSENLPLRCLFLWYYEHLFLFLMLKLHVTSSWFCLYLLIFIALPTHFHMHIQRHTNTSTHVHSAHKRIDENQAQEPGWEGWKKGFVRDLAHTTKKKKKNLRKKLIFMILKKRFEHIELPAKLLDNFLRSNKSSINQSHLWPNVQGILFQYSYVSTLPMNTHIPSSYKNIINSVCTSPSHMCVFQPRLYPYLLHPPKHVHMWNVDIKTVQSK